MGDSSGNPSGFWNSVKSAARKIGNHILVPCGAGGFTYGGPRSGGKGPASTGTYAIVAADSRSGVSSGVFTDVTFGELLQGGYGQAHYSDGSTEQFYFAGLGGSDNGVSLGASLYLSHISGAPWYQFQLGLSDDAAVGPLAGGGGSGLDSDTLTSCIDHHFH